MTTFIGILIIAGLTAVIMLIRYVINSAINKGVDAIHNARVEKKNKENPRGHENLADRYR